MIGSMGERSKSLRQFTFDEDRGPIGGSVANIKVHVMNLDVTQMVGHELSHGSRARGHDPWPVPQGVVECLPRRFEEIKTMRKLAAELGCRTLRSEVRGHVRVVPVGVELANLAGGRTLEDPDMGLGLVREVRDDMGPRISGQKAWGTEVIIGQRREAG